MSKEKKRRKPNDFWQSYSDMMAALLMIFVLVLAGTILQSHMKLNEALADLDAKNQQYEEKSSQLDKKTQQLEEIVGIRNKIIEKLKEEFAGEKLTIDTQTGAIIFDADLMFKFDDDVLSAKGEESLKGFLPKYFGILLSDEFKEYVGEIRIEGHTDDVGDYMYNLQLSQSRALNVSAFILMNKHGLFSEAQLEQLRAMVTASGRSESDLIMNKDKTVNRDASRRVEIQFQLKDEEMINRMLDAINLD